MRLFANHSNEFRQFKNGDKHAFKFLFLNSYGTGIYLYLFWKCGDKHNAKDLTADVFELAWEMRDKIENEDHLVGFLFVTAYHRCLFGQQQDKVLWKAAALAAISAEEAYLFLDDPDVMVAKILFTTDLALNKLPDLQRSVVRKVHIERKSVQRTATEMRLHPQTIRRYHAEAFHALRRQLSDLEFLLVAMGLFLSRETQ